jgi:hypothetical protein
VLSIHDDVSGSISWQLIAENLGVWLNADANQNSADSHLKGLDRAVSQNLDCLNPFVAQDSLEPCFSKDVYPMITCDLFNEVVSRPKPSTSVDDCNGRADLGQVNSILRSSIASTDDTNILFGKEVAVTRGRFDNSPPCKLFFAGYSQLSPPNPCGDYDCDRRQVFAAPKLYASRTKVDAFDLDTGPEIELRFLYVLGKVVAQLAPALGLEA